MVKVNVNGVDYDVEFEEATAIVGEWPNGSGVRASMKLTHVDDDGSRTGIGTLFLDRRGDCVIATSALTGKLFHYGSARDLVEEFVRISEVRQCWTCGHMACAEHGADFAGWTRRTVDTDPGNPEVGPDPYVIDVDICSDCSGHPNPDGTVLKPKLPVLKVRFDAADYSYEDGGYHGHDDRLELTIVDASGSARLHFDATPEGVRELLEEVEQS